MVGPQGGGSPSTQHPWLPQLRFPDSLHVLFSCHSKGPSPRAQHLTQAPSLTGIHHVPEQTLQGVGRSPQGLELRDWVKHCPRGNSCPNVKFPHQVRLSLLAALLITHLPLRQTVRDCSQDADLKAGGGHLCPGLNICLHCDLITPILSPLVGGVPAAHGLH